MNYIIKWNAGYGDTHIEIEAGSEEEAERHAYEMWQDEAESNADYGVVGESTEELREECGI